MFKSHKSRQTAYEAPRARADDKRKTIRGRMLRPSAVADGLKVHYDFNDQTSQRSGIARAYNLASDEATAIHYNSPTYTVDGALTHMVYDGVDDYSRTGTFTNNATDFITIEAVMSFGNFDQTELVFTNATTTPTYIWKTSAGGGQIGFGTGSGEIYGMFASDWIAAGVTADITNFNHIVFVFGDNSSKGKIYVNGVQQTLSFTRGVLNGNYRDPATMTDWAMGANKTGTSPANIGLADFKIYDRELSAREVAYNYRVAESRKGV